MDVEENRGVAIFLYSFYAKTGESVEENEGVAIFLYSFAEHAAQSTKPKRCRPAADDMIQAVAPPPGRFLMEQYAEGSRARPDFLSIFFERKGSRRLPHRYGMRQRRGGGRRPSFLIFCGFLGWRAMDVEENRGVAVFLYSFFARTVESVEENEGVPIFLYSFL